MKKIIPITILTGFLGSGKTTLLNNILKNKENYKIAVIENEYGEESIDSELIQQDVTELIEIKDGCMCCTVRGDLIRGVENLLDSGKEIDYIIVEASGMSEPMPVAHTFIMENFSGRTKLDSIVCVVDAQNYHHTLVQSLHTTCEQIESSHFIILNKVEGVSKEKLDDIKKSIRQLNPHSAIIDTNYSEVDMDYILDTSLFYEEAHEEKKQIHGHHHSHTHKHNHSHASHGHHHDTKSIEKYFYKTQVPCYHLENIKQFLAEISENIFRMKGFICFKDYPGERYILQKAGSCFTIEKDENYSAEGTESKIIFIGKDIRPQELQDSLLKNVFFDISQT